MKINLLTDIFIRALGLLRLFITPYLLTTSEYGNLGFVSAIFIYASFADLGLLRQFEVSSAMKIENLRSELHLLFRKLIPRLFLSAILLSTLMYFKTNSSALFLWTFLYVFIFNFDSLVQTILRHQKKYSQLAFLLALQAVTLTALLAPFIIYGQVTGAIAIQTLTPLLSIFLGIHFLEIFKVEQHTEAPWAKGWGTQISFWLFSGQVLMMAWVTADRFFLMHFLSAHEMGLWNLGAMAGAVLVGVGNTIGNLQIPHWKKVENYRADILPLKHILFLSALWFGGIVSLMITTKWILPKYQDGLSWNMIWLTVNFVIAIVFIIDAFERTQRLDLQKARTWFFVKLYSLLLGVTLAAVSTFFFSEPRTWCIVGFLSSSFTLVFTSLRKYFFNSRKAQHAPISE